MARLMIIDDEPAMVEVIASLCRDCGHEAFPYNSARQALDDMAAVNPQVVIADLRMDDVSGFDVLRECQSMLAQVAFIMVTAYGSVETAVEAMKMGAYDYITKPFKIDELRLTIQRALDHQATIHENVTLRRELKSRYHFENIIGRSPAMDQIFSLVSKVAPTDSTVLLQGDSGTGKELVAKALHYHSRRQHRNFVAINCSALPENLLESELFGHKKGAFTGAISDKMGLFEEAHQGTLFLDEINSMALTLQTKLLRVVQEKEIRRVGDNKTIPVDVRVVAASNEDLAKKIRAGTFREDLYYRLAVILIEVPPLRQRMEDIPLLVNHFLQKQAKLLQRDGFTMTQEALDHLNTYHWPGNVRELENALERACTLCDDDTIHVRDLPPVIMQLNGSMPSARDFPLPIGKPLKTFVEEYERLYIEETLKHFHNDRNKTREALKISLATLYRKLGVKQGK